MKLRVFTLPWEEGAGRFDGREIQAFLEPEPPADRLVVAPQLLPQPADLLLHPQQPLVVFVQPVGQADATRASPSWTLPALPTPRPPGPNESAGNRARQLLGMPRGPVGPGRGGHSNEYHDPLDVRFGRPACHVMLGDC